MVDDDIQDLAPDPIEDGVGNSDEFSDLNETLPPKAGQAEDGEDRPASKGNNPAARIGTLTKRVKERDAIIADKDTQLAAERRQREAAEARLAELEASRSQQTEADLQTKLNEIKARRKDAFEQGELDTYEDLGAEAEDIRAEIRDLKRTPKRTPEPPPREQAPPQQPDYPPAAYRWAERNRTWYDAQPDNPRVQTAQRVFQEILKEGGLDPTSDDFYDELDTRLRESKGQSVTSGPTTGKDQPTQRQGMSGDDLKKMAKWGYDPKKPEDRKRWQMRDMELG